MVIPPGSHQQAGSSARLQKKMLRAFFCVTRFTEPSFASQKPGFVRHVGTQPRKIPITRMGIFLGDPTGIFLEHLFDDLFELRDRFKELGMFIEDGEVHLRDLEVKNDQL